MNWKPPAIILFSITLALLMSRWTLAAATSCPVTVGIDYATIQEAFDQTACRIINIPAGTYNEQLRFDAYQGLYIIRGDGADQTIIDANLALNANGLSVLLRTDSRVLFQGMTIRNADRSGVSVQNIDQDPRSLLLLDDMTITANREGGVAGTDNAAITIEDSTISDNFSNFYGAGVQASGILTIIRSEIVSNTSQVNNDGGGVALTRTGELSIEDSTIAYNVSQRSGGGIFVGSDVGSAEIKRSTIAHNRAAQTGGGVYVLSDPPMNITNSTFADNAAEQGSAIYSRTYFDGNSPISRTLAISFTTFASNHATAGAPDPASTIFAQNSVVTQYHVLHYNNEDFDCEPVDAEFVSNGFNIEPSNDCYFHTTFDRPNTPSAVLPLADNGGPTATMLPATGSPAIDGGLGGAFYCGISEDQRGEPRPYDTTPLTPEAYCDIGAVEWRDQDVAPPTAVSLRQQEAGLRDQSADWLRIAGAYILLSLMVIRAKKPHNHYLGR